MEQIPVFRSFIAGETLAERIAADYGFDEPVRCKLFSKLIRTQDNDHYQVTVGDKKYVARIYQQGDQLGRQESDYQFEMEWLLFLAKNGVPVTYPIVQKNGRLLSPLNAPEGIRYYTLLTFAEGKPMELDNEEHFFAVGAAMAKMHMVSNKFRSKAHRTPMDLSFLVDKPVARMRQVWAEDDDREDDLDMIITAVTEAKNEILALIDNELSSNDSWGVIGGDFHQGNAFMTDDNQLTFFNFDWCGYGWRSYDIAAFLSNSNLIHRDEALSEAFFAGYYSERPLSDNEHASIAPFLTIRRAWLTAYFTMNEGIAGYTFIAPAWVRDD